MTAVNIVRRPGEILIMTDGLAHDVHANKHGDVGKLSILPHLPLLVACRGLASIAHVTAARFACDVRGTFDDFLEWVPIFARQIVPEVCALQRATVDQEFYIVGYSAARSQLEAHFMTSGDAYVGQGRQPYTLYLSEDPMTAAPQPSGEAINAAGFVVPPLEGFNPGDHGVKLMDAQRRTYPEAVGRFMQLSRVTREGISSHVIHRWVG